MHATAGSDANDSRSWPATIGASVEMTDEGLVFGAGSLLARMANAGGRLALDADRDRMVALLSVASRRRVAAAEVLHHVEAAAGHWQRGDKALANLRLIFADLPRLADPTDAYRLCLAEYLLDEGMAPAALMAELGFGKYNRDEPRVAPGVPEGGQWTFGPGGGSSAGRGRDNRIRVAGNDAPPEDEKTYEERRLLGLTTPEEDVAHGRGNDPANWSPPGSLTSTQTANQLAAAKQASQNVGPGRGPVYGTAVHTEFKSQVKALGRSDLNPEQSYFYGKRKPYGTRGSIRVDAAEGDVDKPTTVYDLKTGDAVLTASRIRQLRTHLPDGQNVTIHEVRP